MFRQFRGKQDWTDPNWGEPMKDYRNHALREIAAMATQAIDTELGGSILRQIEAIARDVLGQNHFQRGEGWRLLGVNDRRLTVVEQARRDGFAVIRGGEYSKAGLKQQRELADWCRDNDRPFVYVANGRKFAIVVMDLITTQSGTELSGEGQDRAIELLRRYADRSSHIQCGRLVVAAYKVPREHGEKLARALVAVFDECCIREGVA